MNDNAKKLLKLVLGAGLALIEPDRREETARNVRDRFGNWTETARDKFEDVADRLDRVSYALRGKERWTSKAGTFLLGLGVGVGIGMLFAPASGQEVRESISEQASNIRDRFSEQASNLKERVRDTVRREGSSGEGSSERVQRPA
jgi:gas vesicle protein